MKTIAPDYYEHFACIAGRCRHSCCIGWEIDIDAESLKRYQAMPGAMGERLRQNIDVNGDYACFRLTGWEERCPFLNADGLCDMILELGEDSLCQICTDHPRFRHFWQDRTELGLGLCCEEAARLVLGWQEPVGLTVIEDDGCDDEPDEQEDELRRERERLIRLMQNRSLSVESRMESLLEDMGISAEEFDWQEWIPFLLSLEMLDSRWAELLEPIAQAECVIPELAQVQLPMEQWMVYLLYRHLPAAMEGRSLRACVLLAALMWLLAAQLYAHHGEALPELCRLCSSELEYSEENLEAIADELISQFGE